MLEIIAVLTPLVVPIITAVMQIMTLRSQKKLTAKVDEIKDVNFAIAQATAALAPERDSRNA